MKLHFNHCISLQCISLMQDSGHIITRLSLRQNAMLKVAENSTAKHSGHAPKQIAQGSQSHVKHGHCKYSIFRISVHYMLWYIYIYVCVYLSLSLCMCDLVSVLVSTLGTQSFVQELPPENSSLILTSLPMSDIEWSFLCCLTISQCLRGSSAANWLQSIENNYMTLCLANIKPRNS